MKAIKFTMGVLMIIFTMNSYGQNCKIEFFLLKKEIVSIDSVESVMVGDTLITIRLPGNFHATIDDLEETAFIADNEINSFYIHKYISENKTVERHFFIVPKTVVERINKQEIPLCCGKQFALLIDDNIVYGGYFWNFYSSFSCNGIVAVAFNEGILIERKLPDYGYENEMEETTDIRQNQNLFNCLKSTDRMKNND